MEGLDKLSQKSLFFFKFIRLELFEECRHCRVNDWEILVQNKFKFPDFYDRIKYVFHENLVIFLELFFDTLIICIGLDCKH